MKILGKIFAALRRQDLLSESEAKLYKTIRLCAEDAFIDRNYPSTVSFVMAMGSFVKKDAGFLNPAYRFVRKLSRLAKHNEDAFMILKSFSRLVPASHEHAQKILKHFLYCARKASTLHKRVEILGAAVLYALPGSRQEAELAQLFIKTAKQLPADEGKGLLDLAYRKAQADSALVKALKPESVCQPVVAYRPVETRFSVRPAFTPSRP